MKDKLKLTELTKEELRQVTGGKMGGSCECGDLCTGNKQSFGQDSSASMASDKPPTVKPRI